MGAGGFGDVYKVRQINGDEIFALKTEVSSSGKALNRLKVNLTEAIRENNICKNCNKLLKYSLFTEEAIVFLNDFFFNTNFKSNNSFHFIRFLMHLLKFVKSFALIKLPKKSYLN